MNFDALESRLAEDGRFDDLTDLYESLPQGQCPGCGICCYDAVQTSFVEFLWIRRYLKERGGIGEPLKERTRNYVVTELIKVNPCPFLLNNRCDIYPVRPLTCRLFGFQSRNEQNQRRIKLMKEHKAVQRHYLEVLHARIPQAVIDHVIPFCEAFLPLDKWNIQKSRLVYDRLMALDAPYYIEGAVPERYLARTLVDWLLIDMDEEERVYELREHALKYLY